MSRKPRAASSGPQSAKRGSVLIASLWIASFLSIVTVSLHREASQHVLLMQRERDTLQDKAHLISGLHMAASAILSDATPYEASAADEWYGEIQAGEAWEGRIKARVFDEEAKISLNHASEGLLREFLKTFEERIEPLKGERKDWIHAVLKLRGRGKIESYEELLLAEGIHAGDWENLRPCVTVYPALHGININTADFLILEAVVNSLAGDEFAKCMSS